MPKKKKKVETKLPEPTGEEIFIAPAPTEPEPPTPEPEVVAEEPTVTYLPDTFSIDCPELDENSTCERPQVEGIVKILCERLPVDGVIHIKRLA